MDKLFVITRRDLEPGDMLAQSCHAVSSFAVRYPDIFSHWALTGKNIVCLAARDEQELHGLLSTAAAKGVNREFFAEPDLGGQLTAIALGTGGHKVCSHLPLAFRKARAVPLDTRAESAQGEAIART